MNKRIIFLLLFVFNNFAFADLEITGAKLITSAYLFGLSSLAFCTLPFLIIVAKGLKRLNDSNSGGGNVLVNTLFLGYFVHFISAISFFAFVLVLNQLNIDDTDFYTSKVFPIFWAETQKQVYSLSGADSTSTAVQVAYSTLYFVQTLVKLFLMLIPISITFIGGFYGIYLANKDRYKTSALSIATYSVVAIVMFFILYVFWAMISTQAMFLPDSQNLVEYTNEMWKNVIK